jgi:hypothetical protein
MPRKALQDRMRPALRVRRLGQSRVEALDRNGDRRLTEIKRLFAALEKLVSPQAIGPWLKDPNPAFDGSTPLQVIERGETDRIWRMVYELESGEPA